MGELSKTRQDELRSPLEEQILLAIRGIRYGSVEIVIHDSQIVQIERREKVRLGKADPERRYERRA